MATTSGVSSSTTGLASARAAGISSSTGTKSNAPTSSGLTTANAVLPKLQPYIDQITNLQDQETSNTTKITSYQTMQRLLTDLETASNALRTTYTGSSNAYNNRTAAYTTDTTTAASTILTASIAAGTTPGSHTVKVTQLATTNSISSPSGTYTSSSGASTIAAGTYSLGAGSSSASVVIPANASLSTIVNDINYHTSVSGVSASILQVSSTDYRLVLTASKTDQTITGGSSFGATQTITSAQPALLTVDGISGISRTNNIVSDVLTGVTLDLNQANTSTTVTMTIGYDTSAVQTAVSTFATAYNYWRQFVNTNQSTTSNGTASSSAVLFGDASLRRASDDIDLSLSKLVGGNSLSGIGLSLNGSNYLLVNSTTLASTLTNNFSNIQILFGGTGTATGIADAIYSTAHQIGNSSIGSVQQVVSSLQYSDVKLAARITELQTQASVYETFLLQQYARTTAKIASSNNLSSLLMALTASNSSN